jgi:hypothetical protein
MNGRSFKTSGNAPTSEPDDRGDERWSLLARIAFRFCFCYLLPLGLGCISIFAEVTFRHSQVSFWKFYTFDPWFKVLPWVCRHVFHVQRDLTIYPDSDMLSGYLQHFVELIVALVATTVWSILDHRRKNYRRLYGWFALYLRFCLSITLCNYGFDKVFPNQFGSLTPSRILQHVGNLTLFEMLWTFMAASKGYTVFCGALEVLAGVLLLLPRLEILGSLLAFSVLTNVVVLNLFYNVGVLVFSSHLLFIAAFLAAPALARILVLVVSRRMVELPPTAELSARRLISRGIPLFVNILGLVLCLCSATVSAGYSATRRAQEAALPFPGAWTVDTFVATTAGKHALFTEKLAKDMQLSAGEDHWVRLYFESRLFAAPNSILIELKNGTLDAVSIKYDPTTGTALLSDSDDPGWKAVLTMKSAGKDLLEIKGAVNGVPVTAVLHREEVSQFPLTRDEIHFIQEDN